LSLSNRLL